jgi:hypothetical protein
MVRKIFGIVLALAVAPGCVGTADEGDVDEVADAAEESLDTPGIDTPGSQPASIYWPTTCGGWSSAGTCPGGYKLSRTCGRWVCNDWGTGCFYQTWTESTCVP